jgi:hypothetical protein
MSFDFTPVVIFLLFLGGFIVGAVWLCMHLLSSNEIKVNHKLQPIRYELTVKNNKIDTVWVYVKP